MTAIPREVALASSVILREVVMWNASDEFIHVRYDFLYRDPASGWVIQYHIDTVHAKDDAAERDERAVPTVKATLGQMLKRKCGIPRALENQGCLELPRGVSARYV